MMCPRCRNTKKFTFGGIVTRCNCSSKNASNVSNYSDSASLNEPIIKKRRKRRIMVNDIPSPIIEENEKINE